MNLVALWNFDGNLLNFSSVSDIDGSFDNGGANNCRLSAYTNESTAGAYSMIFVPHATVINLGGDPNPFPGGFVMNAPFKQIPDNYQDGIMDTIIITNPTGYVSSMELFISIQHQRVGDLVIYLKAPNGTTSYLSNNCGGSGSNVLSFFNDAYTYMPTSNEYLPPGVL